MKTGSQKELKILHSVLTSNGNMHFDSCNRHKKDALQKNKKQKQKQKKNKKTDEVTYYP